MNRKVGRRYLPVVMMATTLAMASACSPKVATASGTAGTSSVTPSASASASTPATPTTAVASLTLSNGTANVAVGKTTVQFSSNATDASWSADGSRIAYVDGDGNVATARPDGSDVVILTKTSASVTRAEPVWGAGQNEIEFAERDKSGVWRLKSVPAADPGPGQPSYGEDNFALGGTPATANHAPTSAYIPASGANEGVDLLAYQHDAASGAQIWIVDYNQREPESVLLMSGSEPALSADGKELAYVGSNHQLYVTPVAKASKSSSVQITFGLTGIAHPVWSPDGSRVAFATASDVESVSAKPASGATANPTTVESTKVGVPSFVPSHTDTVHRFTGQDPIADAISLSQQTYNLTNAKTNVPSQGNLSMPEVVTLVSTQDQSVLTNIGGLAGINGPVLFTDGKTLDPRVATEIKRALAKKSFAGQELTVQIYGSTGVMSSALETSVKALGYTVKRIGAPKPPTLDAFPCLVASATDQAVLGNLTQLSQNYNVILIHGSTLSAAQRALFKSDEGKPVQVTVAGADAKMAAQASWSGKPAIKITELPTTLPDESVGFEPFSRDRVALVAAGDWKSLVLANLTREMTIVVDSGGNLTSGSTTWLNENAPSITDLYAFGSTSAVPDATVTTFASATSGPAGFTGGGTS